MSRHEKKLKDKLDDEIKLAGLEALVPEELEKQLNVGKSGENKTAKALWSKEDAKDKGICVYDVGSVQQNQTKSHVRLALSGQST